MIPVNWFISSKLAYPNYAFLAEILACVIIKAWLEGNIMHSSFIQIMLAIYFE